MAHCSHFSVPRNRHCGSLNPTPYRTLTCDRHSEMESESQSGCRAGGLALRAGHLRRAYFVHIRAGLFGIRTCEARRPIPKTDVKRPEHVSETIDLLCCRVNIALRAAQIGWRVHLHVYNACTNFTVCLHRVRIAQASARPPSSLRFILVLPDCLAQCAKHLKSVHGC